MDVGLELVIQRVEVGIGGAGIGDLAGGLELGDVGETVVGQRDQKGGGGTYSADVGIGMGGDRGSGWSMSGAVSAEEGENGEVEGSGCGRMVHDGCFYCNTQRQRFMVVGVINMILLTRRGLLNPSLFTHLCTQSLGQKEGDFTSISCERRESSPTAIHQAKMSNRAKAKGRRIWGHGVTDQITEAHFSPKHLSFAFRDRYDATRAFLWQRNGP